LAIKKLLAFSARGARNECAGGRSREEEVRSQKTEDRSQKSEKKKLRMYVSGALKAIFSSGF
jgi:hypothetical protein